MTEIEFVENLMKNLAKNGYPHQKVAFPLERLYEAAYLKGLNFNKVLEHLSQKGIDHEKTATKVIFFPLQSQSPLDQNPSPNLAEMMAQAKEMFKNMSPEQVAEIQKMVMNMSPEEREDMVKQAQKFARETPLSP